MAQPPCHRCAAVPSPSPSWQEASLSTTAPAAAFAPSHRASAVTEGTCGCAGAMLKAAMHLLAGRATAVDTTQKIMADFERLMDSGDPGFASEILKPEVCSKENGGPSVVWQLCKPMSCRGRSSAARFRVLQRWPTPRRQPMGAGYVLVTPCRGRSSPARFRCSDDDHHHHVASRWEPATFWSEVCVLIKSLCGQVPLWATRSTGPTTPFPCLPRCLCR